MSLPLKRSGFTLVETLVVIALIGLLVGLLIPAVMYARASAARTQCQNNLRQIGLAMQQYVTAQGGFPPLVSSSFGWDGETPTGTVHLWSVYLLPYLEQQSVSGIYDFNKPFFANTTAIATQLPVFQCPMTPLGPHTATTSPWKPSIAFDRPSLRAIDEFLTCQSVTMAAGDYASYDKVSDDWKLFLSYPANTPSLVGVLAAPPKLTAEQLADLDDGESIPVRAISRPVSEVTDGLTNTILVVECAGKPQQWRNGQLSGPGNVMRGAGWADPAGVFTMKGNVATACLMNCVNDADIYSFHSGGANFAFADASVRFLSNSISLETLVALLTAKAADVPGSDW